MKIKIDENLPTSVADILANAGHDAVTVYEQSLQGAKDSRIFGVVTRENRVLLTLDVGFADIRTYPPAEHSGIVVFRLQKQDRLHIEGVVRAIAEELIKEEVGGKLWIVEEDRIRIRS